MYRRLSALMFLLYAAPGAIVPLFSLRMQELGFSPLQLGTACATQAIAALIGPLLAGQIADRWWPVERCLGVCGLGAGTMLWLLTGLTRFPAVFAASLGFWLMWVPASSLAAALCFSHLPDPERQYGRIRLWGTVGWVLPGWLLGLWFGMSGRLPWLPAGSGLTDTFRLGGLLALGLGLYALTLPHTPPQYRPGAQPAPIAALALLRRRPFAVYAACTLGLCVTLPFTTQVTPLLLQHLGISRPWLTPTLTLAQTMEVVALAMLPMALLRLGVRGTMILGLGAWTLALSMLTIGWPMALVVGSLGLNGLCISFFLVAGQVFVNGQASADIRASAQGLLAVITGSGLLIGNLLVALVRTQANGDFLPIFGVGAAIATSLIVAFAVGFPGEDLTLAAVPVKEPLVEKPEPALSL